MITDRTAQDVANAKQIRDEKVKAFLPLTQAEEETLERGMLTVNTLNRIENKQAAVKALLNGAGYWNTPITNKTWSSSDWLFSEEWQRIINNDDVLKRAFFVYSDTEDIPDMNLGFEELNAIESILVDLAAMYAELISGYRKCGTFKCGGSI